MRIDTDSAPRRWCVGLRKVAGWTTANGTYPLHLCPATTLHAPGAPSTLARWLAAVTCIGKTFITIANNHAVCCGEQAHCKMQSATSTRQNTTNSAAHLPWSVRTFCESSSTGILVDGKHAHSQWPAPLHQKQACMRRKGRYLVHRSQILAATIHWLLHLAFAA